MNEYRPIGVDSAINMLVQLFGKPYIVPDDNETKQLVDQYNVSVKVDDKYDRLSQFGTPVFGTFKMQATKGCLVYNNVDRLAERDYAEFEFPLATIVDFSRKKNLVISNTIGSQGSVKEIMGLGDWEVNIRGILCDDSSRLAQQKAKQQQYAIDRINEIVGSIRIEGKIFAQHNITNICIQDVNYTAVQGKPDLLQYEIKALSDEEFFITGNDSRI